MLSKGFGYKPNKPDNRDFGFERLGLSSVSTLLLDPIDLEPWEPEVYNQGNTNTCVAQGMVAQIEIIEHQAFGFSFPYSKLALYTGSRLDHSIVLFDSGTYPRSAAKMASKLGLPRETEWPFEVRKVNRRLPVSVRMLAHGAKGMQYAFLFSTGSRLVDEIVQALRGGYPVGFGTRVSWRYVREPNQVETRPSGDDKIAGNHWQVIVGARVSDGQVQFKVRNSYGRFWGEAGYVWLTENYITWPYSRDFMVIYGWDRIRNARPIFSL